MTKSGLIIVLLSLSILASKNKTFTNYSTMSDGHLLIYIWLVTQDDDYLIFKNPEILSEPYTLGGIMRD